MFNQRAELTVITPHTQIYFQAEYWIYFMLYVSHTTILYSHIHTSHVLQIFRIFLIICVSQIDSDQLTAS